MTGRGRRAFSDAETELSISIAGARPDRGLEQRASEASSLQRGGEKEVDDEWARELRIPDRSLDDEDRARGYPVLNRYPRGIESKAAVLADEGVIDLLKGLVQSPGSHARGIRLEIRLCKLVAPPLVQRDQCGIVWGAVGPRACKAVG